MRKNFGLRLLERGEFFIDCARHQPVQILAPTLEQRLVGRIADQGVLELVGSLRRDPTHIEELRIRQAAQRALEIRLANRGDRVEQCVGKIAANHGADLRNLLGRPQPVQPRHQRIVQGRRDLAPCEPRTAALEHRARQLLDEERHSSSAIDHRRDGLGRQGLARCHLFHHRADVARAQSVERDLRVMFPQRPLSAELRARGIQE